MVATLLPDAALASPSRAELHAAVAACPGITFRALCRQTGYPAGTARHHLNVLIRSAVLREERVGCKVAFLPATDQRSPAALTALMAPGMATLRELVASKGRVCQRDVLDCVVGVSRSTVQHRLQRLVAAGVLRLTTQGRYLFYEVAQ